MKNKIPDFKNFQEEAKFWETHDITDYLEELEPIKVEFKAKMPKEEMVVVRLQGSVKKRLQKVADRQGLNLSTMLRSWMIERLRAV
jgi:predicted DNA binding CopG/RHH family protein